MSEQRKKTKYIVYAKILGDFLPERKVKIGECHIEKTTAFLERDLPEIPIIEKRSASHSLSKGVDAFIHYPQQPVSIRTFESSYLVSTEISEENLYFVLKEAEDRFTDLIASLSLALKRQLNNLARNVFDAKTILIMR
ncbi:hypothetical protein IPH19_05580 [Candidatus Uhrbacteria bacterium]|nr:MAG: hypothetical protein IPH19_05580 [Candidatus Uhrbacteria bacterium]